MSTAIVVNGIGEPLTEELEGIFRDHYPMVYRTAYSLTGSPQDAEDIERRTKCQTSFRF